MNRPASLPFDTRPTSTRPVDTLITNAHVVVDRDAEYPGGWIALAGGRVAAVGHSHQAPPPAGRTIDAGGRLVTPGLVNTHHHMYQNLTRAYGPAINGSLFDWLTTLYPLWAGLDEENVYLSTYVGIVELLMGGCTTSSDHLYVHPRPGLIDAQVTASTELGFRFMATRGSMTRSVADGGLPPESVVQDHDTIMADAERLVGAHHDPAPGAMTRIALAPCSPFSVSEEIMVSSAEFAEKHDVRLHSHLAEDHDEDTYCLETYGCRPVEYFERVGWASDRAWVAHFIYPSDDEVARLASAGVGAAQCPSSNMMIGQGSMDAMRMRSMGLTVGLGCDGSASTDSASLWMETRNALLLGRLRNGPASMRARDALDMATRGSAACLGWDDEIGHLRPGACADLVVWETHPVALAGALVDPVEAWLRTGPSRAWHTLVAGRVLVEDGEPVAAALPEVLRRHRAAAAAMQNLL
ncbi:8-oxoguanine deaminase [Arthrobacter ginkgonis]|uniref:8-oxoguanine deaminase n=1 Tax=Arthrobacter ginkgonis TaxID=1630594 RepID=A0ABP7CPE8_9MICC